MMRWKKTGQESAHDLPEKEAPGQGSVYDLPEKEASGQRNAHDLPEKEASGQRNAHDLLKKEAPGQGGQKLCWNRKKRTAVALVLTVLLLALVIVAGILCGEKALKTDLALASQPPGPAHPFGTDWMGRDMLARTLKGLSLSIVIGGAASIASGALSLGFGILAATLGRKADAAVSYLIDLILGIPHLLLLVLISLAVGRGLRGVVLGIVLTHWPTLARVIRGEILQLKEQPYILAAGKLGKSRRYIVLHHMLPNILPQFLTGMLLTFPHAILHESSITFLGFGLSSEQPAIGNILSESMRYLITRNWWLAIFPGILLVCVVLLFQYLGESLRRFADPAGAHR